MTIKFKIGQDYLSLNCVPSLAILYIYKTALTYHTKVKKIQYNFYSLFNSYREPVINHQMKLQGTSSAFSQPLPVDEHNTRSATNLLPQQQSVNMQDFIKTCLSSITYIVCIGTDVLKKYCQLRFPAATRRTGAQLVKLSLQYYIIFYCI